MKGLVTLSAAVAATVLLAACTPTRSVVVQRPPGAYGSTHANQAPRAASGGSYRVVKGDTLTSISFRHGVDVHSLARWNAIAPPYTIWPGQQLRLGPSGGTGPTSSPTRVVGSSSRSSVLSGKPASATGSRVAPTQAKPLFEPIASTSAAAAPTSSHSSAKQSPENTVPVAGVAPANKSPPGPTPSSAAPAASGGTRTVDGITWRWPADGSVFKKFQSGDAIPGVEIAGHSGAPVRAAADGVVVYSGNGLVGYGELVIIKHSDSFLSAYGHNSKRLVKEGQRVSAGQEIAEMGSTGAPRDELQFQIRRNGNPVDPLQYLPGR